MLVDRVDIVIVPLGLLLELAGAFDVDAGAFGVVVEGDELPHAVSTAAAPASTGAAHQRVRMSSLRFLAT
jgi:hypothetical protein